jgi:hypothetical protein
MVLVESSWEEGEEIFLNWQSLYPPHLGGLPLNTVVYINFRFENFKNQTPFQFNSYQQEPKPMGSPMHQGG